MWAGVRLLALTCSVFVAVRGSGQDLASFEKRVTVKVLPNGLTLLLCQRPEAPVFSYATVVDAGDADDPTGQTGLAHMFEHLAFKGTKDLGSTDYKAEKIALDKVEVAYAAYDAEQRKRVNQDPAKLKELKAAFESAEKDADRYVIPNEFTEVADVNGAAGLNAMTSLDETQYFWSMPSNRLELWAFLESDRIGNTVPRQFYRERDVVMEERRMRVDSNPFGRVTEQFLQAAYAAHPYHRPNVGFESDLHHITATQAAAFHAKYYVPSNIVVSVAGDVTPADLAMLEKYFGALPAGPKPEEPSTVEPVQIAEKAVMLKDASQPIYLEGYHRPDYRDPDDAVYDAIQDILTDGRTSRLYRSLVRDQQVAAVAQGVTGIPGIKYPSLFAFFAMPNQGHTPQEMRTAIHQEIEKLKTTDVTDEELEMYRTRSRAGLLHSLADNQGLAMQLAFSQVRYGDWRETFRQLSKIDAVSKADIRRVANKIFVDENRTYAIVEHTDARPAAAVAGGAQ